MSSSYDHRGSSRRRGVWSHWVPLALTVAVASAGVAAWVWSQRKDEHEESETEAAYQGLDYDNADYGDNAPYGTAGPPPRSGPGAPPSYGIETRDLSGAAPAKDPSGWGAQMTGALRRT